MADYRHSNQVFLDDLREAFSLCDQDGDGEIRAEDLTEIMKILGYNHNLHSIHNMLQTFDRDGNESINFIEFVMLILSILNQTSSSRTRSHISDVYKLLDPHNQGEIDSGRLSELLMATSNTQNWSKTDAKQLAQVILKEADPNQTGHITFDKFMRIMLSGVSDFKKYAG